MAKVVRLPPVLSLKPTESVFTTCGRSRPRRRMSMVSASCMAIDAREPPMSGEPSTRLTEPSELTLAETLDLPPQLNQKPLATPRPRFACPRAGRCSGGARAAALRVSSIADAGVDGAVGAAVALRDGVAQPELLRVHAAASRPVRSIDALGGEGGVGAARGAVGGGLRLVDDDVVAVDADVVEAGMARRSRRSPAPIGEPGKPPAS